MKQRHSNGASKNLAGDTKGGRKGRPSISGDIGNWAKRTGETRGYSARANCARVLSMAIRPLNELPMTELLRIAKTPKGRAFLLEELELLEALVRQLRMVLGNMDTVPAPDTRKSRHQGDAFVAGARRQHRHDVGPDRALSERQ